MASNKKDNEMVESEEQTLKDIKQQTSGLMKVLITLMLLLVVVVGYLIYSLMTSPQGMKNSEELLASIFKKEEVEQLHPLDEFTIKLADNRYAVISMSLGYIGEEESIKPIIAIIRDKVIFELMALDSKNLDATNIEITKKLLIKQLNEVSKDADIRNIYIDNLVVQ